MTEKKKAAKPVVAGLVVVALAGAGLGFWRPFQSSEETVTLKGVVEIREVRLGSKAGGRVQAIYVKEGDTIESGQLLAKLEAPELEAQLRQWEAKLKEVQAEQEKAENGPRKEEKEAAKAARDAAEARWQRMKAGYRAEDKANAQGNLDAASADLRFATEEFNRVEKLYKNGASKLSELDDAKAALQRAQGREKAARATWNMMTKGYREEEVAEAEAEYRRLDAQFKLLDSGTRYEERHAAAARVEEIEARIKEIKAMLAEAEIRAPAAVPGQPDWKAIVEVLGVRRGDLVAANQSVMRVLQVDDLWVKVYVPETDLGKVQLGQAVQVKVDSHPDKVFNGTVVQINSASEFTPRNIQSIDERKHQMFGIKVKLDDPQGVFKSCMAAEVIIPVKNR